MIQSQLINKKNFFFCFLLINIYKVSTEIFLSENVEEPESWVYQLIQRVVEIGRQRENERERQVDT